MKTVAEFLTEVISVDSLKKGDEWGRTVHPYIGGHHAEFTRFAHAQKQQISRIYPNEKIRHTAKKTKLNKDHTLVTHSITAGHETTHYHGVVHKNGHVTLGLKTTEHATSPGTHKVSTIVSHNNKFPAHELYHHLITKHNHVMTSDEQSDGGHKIWQRLSRKKGVNVHGWDNDKNKPVNIDKHLRDKTETHRGRDINQSFDDHPEHDNYEDHNDIRHMILVAHKT